MPLAPPLPIEGNHPAIDRWTGEFVDRRHEHAARDYLGATTGRQYSSVQLLGAVIVLALWGFDLHALGWGPASALTLAVRSSLLVTWAYDRHRILANPRQGIDGPGMTAGQVLAVLTILLVAWVRPVPAATHQLDAFIVSTAILMVFANQAVRRLALSAALLVGTDVVLVLRAGLAGADAGPVLVDHAAGWVFVAACSLALNAFRRRSYLHWLAERDARRQLDEEMARRRNAERELTRLAERDDLTGLPNRRTFMVHAAEALAHARESGRPVCALALDADHFKRVNDTWGHQVGDDVLRHVCTALRDLDRSGHIVGRLGGEEFGVVVRAGEARALELAEEIRRRVATDWFFVDDDVLHLTISIGVALAQRDDDVSDLLRRADRALYDAKHAGRDRVCVAL